VERATVPRRSSLSRVGRFLILAAACLGGCMETPPITPAPAVGERDPVTPEGNYRLAMRYRGGDGVSQDERRSLVLLTRAAEGGHPDAQFMLGEAYAGGDGVAQEQAWATMWYGRAAAAGHTESQYRLALAHANGVGTAVSFVDAYKWASVAAASGHEEAGKLRASLSGRMIREEIAPATEAAARWRPHLKPADPDEPLVRFVQFSLLRLGYDSGSVDGVLGARTRGAIRAATQREQIRTDQITPALVDWLRARQHAMQGAGPSA
jgi:localization factor PodJL